MTDHPSASMIVLAGGKSRRMGTEKADLLYNGKSFLETQVQKAAGLGITDILVSGYHGQQFHSPAVRIVPDRNAEKGPLGGLETCLRLAQQEWCLVLSVDAPLVPVEELAQLMAFAVSCGNKAAFLQCGEDEHPLIGMYHRSLAPAMLEEITQRKGSVFAMLRRAGYSVYHSAAEPRLFANINDPESYRQILGGSYENTESM